jgi:hypothetical protein
MINRGNVMVGVIENEQMMLMELLESIEMELGVEFSPQEFKLIQQYLKNNPNADPKKVLDEIIAIAQRKLSKKIDEEKTKRLQKNCEKSKLFAFRAKQTQTKPISKAPSISTEKKKEEKKLNDKEVKRIVDEAEKKLNRKLNEKQKTKAEEYFKTYVKDSDTPLGKANVALLGVICVGIAGGIRPVVLQNWGNLLNAPDLNPYHGESTMDQGNKIDFQRGDPLGLEARAVVNIINTGNIDPAVAAKLDGVVQEQELELKSGSSSGTSRAPSLKPPGSNPLDPFD